MGRWVFFILFLPLTLLGQQHFTFHYLESECVYDRGDTIHIDIFKFYVFNAETRETQLVDVFDTLTHKIRFYFADKVGIGIDSVLNYEGVQGGDLDPMNGMYWSWQSGYINIKLEGHSSKYGDFVFHLGGYQYPFNAFQQIQINPGSKTIHVDLLQIFRQIDLSKYTKVMRPSRVGNQISKNIVQQFVVK